MKTFTKHTLTFCLLLFAFSLFAADTKISVDLSDLGGSKRIFSLSEGIGPRRFTIKAGPVNGRSSALSRAAVKNVGGVLFLSEAVPSDKLKNQTPVLTYDHEKPFGQRVRVNFGTSTGYLPMADWEIVPVAKLVQSGDHGLWSQMELETLEEDYVQRFHVHPAIQDTLVGFLSFLADNPGEYTKERIAYTFRRQAIRGFNRTFDDKPLPESAPSGKFSTQFDVFRLPEASGFDQLMYTDWNQPYTYRLENGRVTITGNPFILFVDSSSGDEIRVDRFNESFRNKMAELHAGNPLLYKAILRVSQNISFFRNVAARYPNEWRAFFDSVAADDKIVGISVESPGGIAAR